LLNFLTIVLLEHFFRAPKNSKLAKLRKLVENTHIKLQNKLLRIKQTLFVNFVYDLLRYQLLTAYIEKRRILHTFVNKIIFNTLFAKISAIVLK